MEKNALHLPTEGDTWKMLDAATPLCLRSITERMLDPTRISVVTPNSIHLMHASRLVFYFSEQVLEVHTLLLLELWL